MAKSKGETQRGPICTPMSRAPYTAISTHGNTKTTMETANGLTQAAMVNIKATPEGISSQWVRSLISRSLSHKNNAASPDPRAGPVGSRVRANGVAERSRQQRNLAGRYELPGQQLD